MLSSELSTSKNIKKAANRNAVQSALRSSIEKLKLYKRVPPHGLLIFCGLVQGDSNKEIKVCIDLEPFRPVTRAVYLCDSKFHTELLSELLEADEQFGFVVMDGSGCLFATVRGNSRHVLHKFSVELPKKHGRGGQSALRFARLRLEKRHNYVRKVAELAKSLFIEQGSVNCEGIILGGSAELKNELYATNLLDPRLQRKVLSVVDVAYGGLHGLNQAIDLAAPVLSNVQMVHQRGVLQRYMKEIASDSGKYCFTARDTMWAVESGAAHTVLCYDELETVRVVLQRKPSEGEPGCPAESNNGIETVDNIEYTSPEQLAAMLVDTNVKVAEQQSLTEWLCDNCESIGVSVEFVSNRSPEGAQFYRGFGGIGALLRYQVDFTEINILEAGAEIEADVDSDEFFV